MLAQMKEMDIMRFIDGRKHRNGDLFRMVGDRMRGAGFIRTVEQIRCRWKGLKQAYYKAKAHNNTSGRDPASCPFYRELNDLLGARPLATVEGIDVGLEPEQFNQDEDRGGIEAPSGSAASPSSSGE